MAEEPTTRHVAVQAPTVSQNQHRADLLQLRGEIREDIHNIQQNIAVITKTIENLQYQVQQGFSDTSRVIKSLELSTQHGYNLLTEEVKRLEQRSQQDINNLRQELKGDITILRQVVKDDITLLRQDTRDIKNTQNRQVWTLVTMIITVFIGGFIKLVFFP